MEITVAALAAGKTFAGVIYGDSKKLRLAEVVKKHGNEDFTCRSGWL